MSTQISSLRYNSFALNFCSIFVVKMPLAKDTRPDSAADHGSWSAEERVLIEGEGKRILAHPSFKSSRRCVLLFSHLLDRALRQDLYGLKERTLGVEVFGREASYDTNADPVVRMAANELRKRLAQFYLEEIPDQPVRILLHPGSYVLHFEFSAAGQPLPAVVVEGSAGAEAPANVPAAKPAKASGRILYLILFLLFITTLGLGWKLVAPPAHTAQDALWQPLLESDQPITINVPDNYIIDVNDAHRSWADQVLAVIKTHQIDNKPLPEHLSPSTSFGDTKSEAWATGFLMTRHHPSEIRGSTASSLDDLRRSPSVFIGLFDNAWALILQSSLRFHVMVDPKTQEEWIEDSQNMGKHQWVGSGNLNFADSSTDYAIISRFRSAETGTWILTIGGMGMHATEAAGQLVCLPEYAHLLPESIRNYKGNLQLIVKTTVISGHTSPPEVVAVHTW